MRLAECNIGDQVRYMQTVRGWQSGGKTHDGVVLRKGRVQIEIDVGERRLWVDPENCNPGKAKANAETPR